MLAAVPAIGRCPPTTGHMPSFAASSLTPTYTCQRSVCSFCQASTRSAIAPLINKCQQLSNELHVIHAPPCIVHALPCIVALEMWPGKFGCKDSTPRSTTVGLSSRFGPRVSVQPRENLTEHAVYSRSKALILPWCAWRRREW